MNKSTLQSLFVAAFISISLTGAQAALVLNGDFEAPSVGGDANANFDFANWSEAGSTWSMDSDDDGRVPGSNPNQVLRFNNNGNGVLTQDLSTNWSTSQTFDLTFNASETWWRTGSTGDSISVSLYQTSDDTLLWTTGTINLDGLHTGSAMPAWTAGQTFSYTIDASTDFLGGTAGENLGIRVQWENGVSYVDNISLAVVPEPSVSLLSTAGAFLLLRRRQR